MSCKEKLISILPYCQDNLEDIILEYMRRFKEEFPISRIADLENSIHTFILRPKITKTEEAIATAAERSLYVMRYLDGSMYEDEEAAREHLDIQRANATVAFEKCKEAMRG